MSHSYSETSKLFQPAFLCSFIPPMILMVIFFFDEKAHQDTWGMIFAITGLLISGTVLVFLLLLQLTVSINEQGISFKYFPYIRTMRTYCWEEIQSAGLITYKPISDFGGWGLKRSKKYGQAYTTKGNKGLWVQLKDGRSFVLSIIDTRQVSACLDQITGSPE